MPLTIGVDASSIIAQKTGIGVAAKNIYEAMIKEAPEIRFLPYTPKDVQLNTPRRILWESVQLPLKVLRDKPDLLYSPGFAPPFYSPVPGVVTVHDLIGMAFPGNQGKASSFYWSTWLPAALKRARRVVASSESTRRDIERFLKIPASRVSVVPLGADESFQRIEDERQIFSVLERYGLKKPFLISVSTLEPRKNHMRLLQAYSILRKKGQNSFSLLVIGKSGPAEAALRGYIEKEKLGKDVHLIGYAPQNDLVALYNAALGYATISLYEGFGLPVLEAMRCGLSGICADRTSLPEVAGDTALLVDPENVEQIADSMNRFAYDTPLRHRLGSAALERSKLFSNTRCARQMIEIFKNETQK